MMGQPKLLLLDEPSMGIAPILVERIYETIAEINQQGTTILLVEQNANFALEVSKRGYVLETGKVVMTDVSDIVADQPRSAEGIPRNMTVFALLGAAALWLMYLWLLSAIVASYLSERKGYGEKIGLAFGLLLLAHRHDHLAGLASEAGLEVEEDRAVGPRQGHGRAARRRRGRDAPRHGSSLDQGLRAGGAPSALRRPPS